MNIYKFSPISSPEQLDTVLEYLTQELENLSQTLLGEKLPINTLKIFAHYQDEYEFLLDLVKRMGEKAPFSSDTSYYSRVDGKTINGYKIDYIGVRMVDPYRLHVGCGDYEVTNFKELKDKFLANNSPFIRAFSEDMIEIWHPDFDVLGYIVPPFEG